MPLISVETFHEWTATFLRPKAVLVLLLLWEDMTINNDVSTLLFMMVFSSLELAALVLEDRITRHVMTQEPAVSAAARLLSASGLVLAIDASLLAMAFKSDIEKPARALLILEGIVALVTIASPIAKDLSHLIFTKDSVVHLVEPAYYIDYVSFLATWALMLIQYGYLMLQMSNFHLSLPSTFLLLAERHAFKKLSSRVKAHRNFISAISVVQEKFPLDAPSPDDPAELDRVCAICWTKVERGNRLPCNHCFHMNCLFLWLRTCAECPTCRRKINFDPGLCIVDPDERDRMREQGIVGGFTNHPGNIGFGADGW